MTTLISEQATRCRSAAAKKHAAASNRAADWSRRVVLRRLAEVSSCQLRFIEPGIDGNTEQDPLITTVGSGAEVLTVTVWQQQFCQTFSGAEQRVLAKATSLANGPAIIYSAY